MILFSPGQKVFRFFATTPLGSIGYNGTLTIYAYEAGEVRALKIDPYNETDKILQTKAFVVKNPKLVSHINTTEILLSFLESEWVKERSSMVNGYREYTLSELNACRTNKDHRMDRISLSVLSLLLESMDDTNLVINRINTEISNALLPNIPDMEL